MTKSKIPAIKNISSFFDGLSDLDTKGGATAQRE
jgi:hypothetical protein